MMFKNRLLVVLFVIFPLAVGLACLSSAPDPTATPIPPEPTVAILETEPPTQEPTQGPTAEPITETEETAPVVSGEFQELVLLDDSLWAQEESSVFVSFFLKNPNGNLIFEDVEYTVHLYDASGAEIESDYSTVRWIFPNQSLGIVHNFWLSDETLTVNDVEVDWVYEGTSTPNGFTDPFSIVNATFWENNDYPMVSGKISNQDATTYTDIKANIICYDSAGEVVGGGYTYLDFIPGLDYTGFATYVDAYGEVASVDIFPTFTYSTDFLDGSDIWSGIELLDDYFYEGDYGSINGGAIIKNITNTPIENSIVYVTFYDQQDNVTTSGSLYTEIILPGQTLGVTPWVLSPPETAESYTYDIMILPGDPINNYELSQNPFVINSAIVTGDYDNYVTVNFTNTYSKQVSEVDIYVLLKNASGQIIGGGNDWTDAPTPAGGSTEIEVWVDYSDSETIDTIEVWVTPNYWTEFD